MEHLFGVNQNTNTVTLVIYHVYIANRMLGQGQKQRENTAEFIVIHKSCVCLARFVIFAIHD